MAKTYDNADLVLWVDRKIIGGKNSDGNQQGFECDDTRWTSTVLPAINGAWHVAGVDELRIFHYWKETGIDPAYYLTEKLDMSGDNPIHYNDKTPDIPTATTLYNTIETLRATLETEYDAAQTAAKEEEDRRKYFVDNDIPENMSALRAQRDSLLKDTDWLLCSDVPQAAPDTAPAAAKSLDNWKTYRQRLRDLPSQQADPYDYANFTGWPATPFSASFVP